MSAAAPLLVAPGALKLEPGVYFEMSYEDYARAEGVRASLLGGFVDATPAHVKHTLDHGEEKDSTPEMNLGHVTHAALLEPARFGEMYTLAPKVAKRSKADKAFWATFEEEHKGKAIISAGDLEHIEGMRKGLLEHPVAGSMLAADAPGYSEVVVVWDESLPNGKTIRCKARIDRITTLPGAGVAVIVDLKTASAANRDAFERAILNYRYFIQAPHYLAGVEAHFPVPPGNERRRFLFIVVESKAPYAVALYEMSDLALDLGERLRLRYLTIYERCVRTGEWPSYSPLPQLVSLPSWSSRRLEDAIASLED